MIAFFYSCDKENSISQEIPLDHDKVITLSRSTVQSSQNERVFPSVELLNQIKDQLVLENDFISNYDILTNYYGRIMWSYATLDVGSDTRYVVCLPFKKDDKITGFLLVQAHEDHTGYGIIARSTLDYQVKNTNPDSLSDIILYGIAKLNYYEVTRGKRLYEEYNKVIEQVFNLTPKQELTRRSEEIYGWSEYFGTEEYTSNGVTYTAAVIINKFEHQQTLPCFPTSNDTGGGSWGGDNSDENEWNPLSNPLPGGDTDITVIGDPVILDPPIEPDCIESMCQEVVEELSNYETIVNPCDTELSPNEIMDLALNDLCDENPDIEPTSTPTYDEFEDGDVGQEVITTFEFESAIDDLDIINPGKINMDDCPCMALLLDDLLEGDPNNFLCKMAQTIAQDEKFNLDFELTDEINISTSNPTGGSFASIIYVPKCFCFDHDTNDCGKSEIQQATEFIHELLHVRYHQVSFNFPGTHASWLKAVQDHHQLPDGEPITGNHHYLFYKYLLDDIAGALKDFNNDTTNDIKYYYYHAHLMINTQQLSDALNGIGYDEHGNPLSPPAWLNDLDDDEKDELLNFDLSSFWDDWISIGGDDAFKLGCL